jgi:hypothetical protein
MNEDKNKTIALKIFSIFEQEKCTLRECERILSSADDILQVLKREVIDTAIVNVRPD